MSLRRKYLGEKRGNRYIKQNDGTVLIELHRRGNKENLYTVIDEDDLDKVINYPYTWFAIYRKTSNCYYAMSTNAKEHKTVLLHKFLMEETKGVVDHINNDTLDNRKSNLRIANMSTNAQNRKSKNRNNKSGYRNVSRYYNQWFVQLRIDGQNRVWQSFH